MIRRRCICIKRNIDYNSQPQLIRKMLDVRQMDKRIERCRDAIRQVESQLCKCTTRLTGLPRSGQTAAWDDLIARKDELCGELGHLQTAKARLAYDVALDPACDLLELDEYRVLCLLYMSGHTLKETARELHMCKTTVYDYEQRSLAKIRTIPDKPEQLRTN